MEVVCSHNYKWNYRITCYIFYFHMIRVHTPNKPLILLIVLHKGQNLRAPQCWLIIYQGIFIYMHCIFAGQFWRTISELEPHPFTLLLWSKHHILGIGFHKVSGEHRSLFKGRIFCSNLHEFWATECEVDISKVKRPIDVSWL